MFQEWCPLLEVCQASIQFDKCINNYIYIKEEDYITHQCSNLDNSLANTLANTAVEVRPDSKVHGYNMGPTWVLSAPDGPHVGPMNLAIREGMDQLCHNKLIDVTVYPFLNFSYFLLVKVVLVIHEISNDDFPL